MTPNQTQIWAIVRMILMFLGSFLVTKGYLTNDQLSTILQNFAQVIGPSFVIVSLVWSLIAHTKQMTVTRASDIVRISASEQAKVGITQPILVPMKPKAQPTTEM